MIWFVRKFWRAIGAALFFFGLFWLPKDVLDSNDALQPWRKLLTMVDQLTAFQILAGVLVLWIIWIDVRPLFIRWRANKRSVFTVVKRVECRSQPVIGADDLYQNSYYVWVGNDGKSGGTLRRVRATMFVNGETRPLPILNSRQFTKDIQHGEWVQFHVGSAISSTMGDSIQFPPVEIEPEVRKLCLSKAQGFHFTFDIPESEGYGKVGYSLMKLDQRALFKWPIPITISANDVVSRSIVVVVDYRKTPIVVTWVNPDEAPSPPLLEDTEEETQP